MNSPEIRYSCDAAIANLLDVIKGHAHHTFEDCGVDPLGLDGEYAIVHTHYRYDAPLVKRIHQLTPSQSVLDILKIAALDFELIFGIVNPQTNSCVVRPPMYSACEVYHVCYENRRPGSHKITSTPFYECVKVDYTNKIISFEMGT